MKNILTYVGVSTYLMLASCSKSNDQEEVFNNFKYGRLEAVVNGKEHVSGPLYPAPYNIDSERILLYCYNGIDELAITMRFPSELGSYNISRNESSAKLTYGDPFDFFDQNDDGPTIDYFAVEGFINITEITEARVVGEFEFIAEDGTVLEEQRLVKEGTFDIERQ